MDSQFATSERNQKSVGNENLFEVFVLFCFSFPSLFCISFPPSHDPKQDISFFDK